MAAITIARDLFADPVTRAKLSYAVGGRCWHRPPSARRRKQGRYQPAENSGYAWTADLTLRPSRSLLNVPFQRAIRASMLLHAASMTRSALSREFLSRSSSNFFPLGPWLSPSSSMCRSMYTPLRSEPENPWPR